MATLQSLATGKVPAVFAKVQAKGLMFLCDISSVDETKDSGGAVISEMPTTPFENIPCLYQPKTKSVKDELSGKFISIVQYEVILPRYFENNLLEIRADDRLNILAQDDEPAKTFRILGIENYYGVYLKVICSLEN